jgi:hypothetical protein
MAEHVGDVDDGKAVIGNQSGPYPPVASRQGKYRRRAAL